MTDSRNPDPQQPRTIVEQGTHVKGTVCSSCPIDVHGRIEGDIETPALYVSASGALRGRAKVGSLRSEGELSGELDAERVELAGRVLDNTVIRARSLQVNLAANAGRLQVIFGECELSVGDEPAERTDEPMPPHVSVHPVDAALTPPAQDPIPEAEPVSIGPAPRISTLPPPDVETPSEAQAEPAVANSQGSPRRKSKNGAGEERLPAAGWSQPPSQPPPAS